MYWYSTDNQISIASGYTNNIYYFKYNENIYPMFFLEDNKIVIYEKPGEDILMSGSYSVNHKNWLVDIETKSGLFTSYDNNTITLNVGKPGFNIDLFNYFDDNYQELLNEFENIYN